MWLVTQTAGWGPRRSVLRTVGLECDMSILSRVRGEFESGFAGDSSDDGSDDGRGDEVPA